MPDGRRKSILTERNNLCKATSVFILNKGFVIILVLHFSLKHFYMLLFNTKYCMCFLLVHEVLPLIFVFVQTLAGIVLFNFRMGLCIFLVSHLK